MRGVALILVLTLQLWANVQPTEGSPLQMLRQFWTPFANRQHDLGRSTPRFPRDFEANYTFSLPYVSTYQKQGLSYSVRVWKHGDKLRLDSGTEGHAVNALIQLPGLQIELSPRVDRMHCRLLKGDDVQLQGTERSHAQVHGVLPDVRSWEFRGSEVMGGRNVDLWVLEEKHESKLVHYNMYIETRANEEYDQPVLLTLHGNALDGSHFDDWRYEWHSFVPGPPSDAVFAKPALCAGVESQEPLTWLNTPHALRMRSLLPPTIASSGGDMAYAVFSAAYGRRHLSDADYTARLGSFQRSVGLIATHNAQQNKSYSLALNKFADWTEEEFRGIMLPQKGRGLRASASPEQLHVPVHPAGRIPRAVDWSKTGADQVVKDQSACGSCWAFGAAGAMQAAWFLRTGEERLFSEQQLMDCSWGHMHNKACDGGLAEGAFDYVTANGGVAMEADVPYRELLPGQDDFCSDVARGSSDSDSPYPARRARFKGYKAVPEGDDAAVMEALFSQGPLAISIDASQPGFRFYSDGIYDEMTCGWKAEDLDHSVMLVGYGTTESGKDFWHVKNSWSQAWGCEGYIKISRDHHGCGVPTNAIYGVPDV